MAVIINTNVDSLKVQGILTNATNKMSSSMQKMSSGLKINSAKDDAAGTVISARMKVQLNGNKIAQNNVQNGIAMLSTAEGNLDVVEENVSRIRDLTLQAKNGTYSTKEIEAMQDEVAERVAEIDRISKSAKYSEVFLFKDGRTENIKFQVGANADGDNIIEAKAEIFGKVTFSALTNDTNATANYNLTTIYNNTKDGTAGTGTKKTFDNAVEALDEALDNITGRKSLIGSGQNRLESALEALTIQYENLSSAKSIITDSDIAAEASTYTQKSILQQVSTSLLAQANQAPSIALSLV